MDSDYKYKVHTFMWKKALGLGAERGLQKIRKEIPMKSSHAYDFASRFCSKTDATLSNQPFSLSGSRLEIFYQELDFPIVWLE